MNTTPTKRGQADYRLLDALTADGRSVPFCTTNKQLAARLGCTPETAKNRVTRLLEQTGCRSRAALAVWWIAQADADVERWRAGVQWRPGEKKGRQ